ncbi:MAG: hypothetical protein M4579_006598 [Chaenotheca gracillima]|nr:MAG: hypothetical protein M4579_006598 [Chaenotheca gracillima]
MSLPSDYLNELNNLNREISRAQPSDVLQFCANYFQRRLESQRAESLLASHHHHHNTASSSADKGTAASSMAGSTFPGIAGASSNPFGGAGAGTSPASYGDNQGSHFGGMKKVVEEDESEALASPTATSFQGEDEGPTSGGPFSGAGTSHNVFGGANDPSAPPSTSLRSTGGGGGFPPASEGFPSNYAMGRRTSVSAESMNPTSSMNDNWTPPFHSKTTEQLNRLKSAIAGNFLFSHLDDEQTSLVLGALVEKPIPAKDIKVISQGDVGDFFYVVEHGEFDIYVNPAGSLQPGPNGMGNKVANIGTGGSFGELALMYNAPRAATVISTASSSCLWALDRVTFRRILMDSTFQRRRMYESFLEEVPLLSTLTPYERSKIADALDTQKFPPGTTIIREGDRGEAFYLLESGEAEVFKRGTDEPVNAYKKGDYFGELALLNDAPRAASVVSKTEVKVATLGKDGFQRLLGPVEGIMRRNDPSKTGSNTYDDVDPLST